MGLQVLEQLERLSRRDPARRGLLGAGSSLCEGQLLTAAQEMAANATEVVIVTGFYIPHATPPASETDGPPGSVYLAQALNLIGVKSHVVTDDFSYSAMKTLAEHLDFPLSQLHCAPGIISDEWVEDFYQTGLGANISHLIAIERAGPSHTPESFQKQKRHNSSAVNDFSKLTCSHQHNVSHNMRGHNIESHNAPLHLLFDQLKAHRPNVSTVGIGDGGNEIGMGSLLWEEINSRLTSEGTDHIPCRVATDWTLIAGTSNWGALALMASILYLKGRTEVMVYWTAEHHFSMLEQMVFNGPAVDGVTGKQETTVDGLPFLTYIQPWILMRKLLEL